MTAATAVGFLRTVPPHSGGIHVVFFRVAAETGPPPTKPTGWERFSGGRVTVHDVGCGHHQMLDAAHVADICAELSTLLARR
ncbi:hypothetical protein AB0478_08455 [Streptomyces sp. NPDC051917]|uniref:hypothetical protein n=1 Tax=Streptomyces sp. NPDC051917 TaxID=3154754 RepID=UPI003450F2E4